MKKRIIFPLSVVIIVIVATYSFIVYRESRPHDITVKVEAPVGTRISGNYQVDGELFVINEAAPAVFMVTGHQVEFSLLKDTQPGEISVTLAVSGSGQAQASTGPGGTVECGYNQEGGFSPSSEVWASAKKAGAD